ncbi:MAG: hypothetical protein I3J02_01200 [Prevotella sp.]|nr:hypothetical protein [Prevotella sp.]
MHLHTWYRESFLKLWGFTKLGAKYTGHYTEEMGWVEKFMTRINDLGGQVKIEDQKGRTLVADPVEYVKEDLRIQEMGVSALRERMVQLKDDSTTYDLLKEYLVDEEEDLFWGQGAVKMIEMIGKQNWLMTQL